jgi:phage regulator Rha-like protein
METCNTISSMSSLTMNSRKIAELVESRHDSVMRSIARLVERGVILKPPTAIVADINSLGFSINHEVYFFDHAHKNDTYIVVAKLAPQFIGKIVDAWGRTENTLNELLQALVAFDVPSEVQDMYVYAIRETETGRIKLGIARNPHQRLQQLQTGNSQRLQLVAYRKASNFFADEHVLHDAASQYRIRGEWFTASALEVMQ